MASQDARVLSNDEIPVYKSLFLSFELLFRNTLYTFDFLRVGLCWRSSHDGKA